MWDAIWTFANSPVGITLLASLMLWALNKLYAAKPAWIPWEGTIVTAVKAAEKAIPDDTPNAGLAKLNNALQFVLNVYEETKGKPATPAVEAELKEGIQIKHAELETDGILTQ